MAVISENADTQASLVLRFNALDIPEAQAVLGDIETVVLQRMEFHGFHPEGVSVLAETHPRGL